MKLSIITTLKCSMVTMLTVQLCAWLLLDQITYADDPTITISRTDTIVDHYIAPYETNSTGFTFDLNSTTELSYNAITVYANVDWCTNLGQTISSVSLYHSGSLINTIPTQSAVPVGNRCAYQFSTSFLWSWDQSLAVTYDTVTSWFTNEWTQVQLSIDSTSIAAVDTSTSSSITQSQILGSSLWPVLTTQNPWISTIQLLNTASPQIEYNNGFFTGMMIGITSKPVSDIIFSGVIIQQIWLNQFGVNGYNIPHTLTLIDQSWSVLSSASSDMSGNIIFSGFSKTIHAWQTEYFSIKVIYSGYVVANNFMFAGSYWDIHDTAYHYYPYQASFPWNQIDILANAAVASNSLNSPSSISTNNGSGGLYIGKIRMVSTTPSRIEALSFINIKSPFYATTITTWTLGCISISECDNISTWWDWLTIYLSHNWSTIWSGTIVSWAAMIDLMQPIIMYDSGQFFDIYVLDPDWINQASETNKVVRLWLLDTQNSLFLGWYPIETQITNTIDNSTMPAQFGTIIYNEHRIRKSLLSINLWYALSGTDSLLTIIGQTWATLLSLTAQSSGSDSFIHQLTFTHTSSGAIASHFLLWVDGTTLSDDSSCTQSWSRVSCILTWLYRNGLPIDTWVTTISLIWDVSSSSNSWDFISTSLVAWAASDYSMNQAADVNYNSAIVWSDHSQIPLTLEDSNRYTDATIELNNIVWYFTMWEQPLWSGGWNMTNLINNITYTHTGSDANLYTITWDIFTGSSHVKVYKKYSNESDYTLLNVVPSTNGRAYVYFPQDWLYEVKLIPSTTWWVAVWPEQVISINHIIPVPPVITLNGSWSITIEAWTSYFDSGAIWTDGTWASWSLITSDIVYSSTPWVYTLRYYYTWSNWLPATPAQRIVTVEDTNIPVVYLNGSSTITLEFGSWYEDSGARYDDGLMGTWEVTMSGFVDTWSVGTYILVYRYVDAGGNTSQITRVVQIVDTIHPTLVLSWSSSMTIAHWSQFADPGALWNDYWYWSWILTWATNWFINTNQVWPYTLLYTYTDPSGNLSNTASRMVNVTDQTSPHLSLSWGDMVILLHSTFNDPGALWNDNVDGSGTISATSGNINIHQLWIYTLTYDYVDHAWNTWNTVSRLVSVVTGNAPSIALNGSSSITLPAWTWYIELWALWNDIEDGTWDVTQISWFVNTWALGTYTISYHYTDQQGNHALPQTRTVTVIAPICGAWRELSLSWSIPSCNLCPLWSYNNSSGWSCQLCPANTFTSTQWSMSCNSCPSWYTSTTWSMNCVDTIAPTITLNSSGIVYVLINSTFIDPGALWDDGINGSGTLASATSGNINIHVAGSYILEYTKVDTSGNTGSITRVVTVTIGNVPSLILSWNNNETITLWSWRTDAGAIASDIEDWDLTATIITSGTALTWVVWTYHVTYLVTDSNNNTISQTRTVIVLAPTSSSIITSWSQTISLLQWGGGWNSAWISSTRDTITSVIDNIDKQTSNQTNIQQTSTLEPIASVKIGEDGTIIVLKSPHTNTSPGILAKDISIQASTGDTISNTPILLKPYRVITLDMLSNISLLQSWYQPTWDAVPYQSRRIFNFDNTRD